MTHVSTTASSLILRSSPVIGPHTDTGKRFFAGQIAVSLGETFDKSWQFVRAPTGDGWASSAYLKAAPIGVAPTPIIPKKLYSLDGEDPQLTAAIEQLRQKARAEGIEFDTADFGGVRTEADTIRIMKYRDDDYAVYVRNLARTHPGKKPEPKESWRRIARFGTSYHNFGAARDLKITARPTSFSDAEAMRRLGALAPSCGLKWGGSFNDPPHMQLPITLAEARDRWLARQ